MGNVRLYGATSGYTELAPPAVAPDGVLSLPTGTGTIAKTTDQGLVHINTTTFSAVSSVSVDDCFTSDYENYRILIEMTASAGADLAFRYRLSGTDASGANSYVQQRVVGFSTTVFTDNHSNTYGYGGGIQTVAGLSEFEIRSPALAITTKISQKGGSTAATGVSTGYHTAATAYDGITVYPTTGNITGTLRIYGYKNGA